MENQHGTTTSNPPKRTNADYLSPSRWESIAHLKTELKKKPHYTASDFLSKSLWNWIYHYFKSRFGKKYPYPTYQSPDSGVYELVEPTSGEAISIAIASDWATDTDESFEIGRRMQLHKPHYTIHVGDTYYVGAPHEVKSNFIGEGAPWPRGSAGSFALLGNHEMYARGKAFFEHLLPSLGLRNQDGTTTPQKAGFFCLQNKFWRILGLDTGYHSTGKPILEFLPFFAPDCHLDNKLIDWLKNVVRIDDPSDKRGLVILTHHQFISAFNKEHEYMKPASQLGDLLGRDRKIIWLWGHEHKLSFFEKIQLKNSPQVYGRCIGFGGTPVEVKGKGFGMSKKLKGYEKLVAVDTRENKSVKDVRVGFNGYVVVKIAGAQLRIEYHDSDVLDRDFPGPLAVETWQVKPDGDMVGEMVECKKGLLTFAPGKSLADAVKG